MTRYINAILYMYVYLCVCVQIYSIMFSLKVDTEHEKMKHIESFGEDRRHTHGEERKIVFDIQELYADLLFCSCSSSLFAPFPSHSILSASSHLCASSCVPPRALAGFTKQNFSRNLRCIGGSIPSPTK